MEPYWLMYHIIARFDKRGNWGGGVDIWELCIFCSTFLYT